MKRFRLIQLQSLQFDQATQPQLWLQDNLDYILLIRQLLRIPLNRQMGATPDEMRRSIRVLDALEYKVIGDLIELEDADWDHLKAKVFNYPWPADDPRFLQFINTVENANEQDID